MNNCKGSWSLGTACTKCDRCEFTKPERESMQHFTMSQFATKEDMFKARSEYYESELAQAQKEVEALKAELQKTYGLIDYHFEQSEKSKEQTIMEAVYLMPRYRPEVNPICCMELSDGGCWINRDDLLEYASKEGK